MIPGASQSHTDCTEATLPQPKARKQAARIPEHGEVRWELVARIRAEIATGTFETPERIEATVDALLEELAPAKTAVD
jgi:anti-sigma28 factor (negative regulator of flagellin synthesis)